MSFKFFRKHQKIMLWIIVIITIFTFSLFSVTSTLRACFKEREGPESFASFSSKDGSRVEITEKDFYMALDLVRRFMPYQAQDAQLDEMVYSHIIHRHEAMAAGIRVTDGEISNSLSQMGFAGSKEDYFTLLRRMGFTSATQFEEGLRELMVVEKYKRYLTLTDDLLTSEEIYEEFKLENEEFKLAYVAFPYEKYGQDLTQDSVDEEELTKWYEKLNDNSPEVRDHFSEAEKFEFDIAYLDLKEANYDDYADLVNEAGIDVSSDEVRGRYNLVKDDRFRIEPEEPEAPEEEAPAEEEPEEANPESEEAEPEAEEKPVEYVPEAEVKDELEKELKLAKLVEKASTEWVEYARTSDLIGKSAEDLAKEKAEKEAKEAEEKSEDEESDDDSDASEDENDEKVEEEEETPEEHYEALIAKYMLKTDRIEGPISLDDLENIKPYGTEVFKRMGRFLKENNARYIAPDSFNPDLAFFAKTTKFVDRRKKELDEILDDAKVQYIKNQRQEMSRDDAKGFMDQLKEKARELDEVKDTIAQWEADAKQKAADSVEKTDEMTEEELTRLRENAEKRELARLNPEIETLLKRHLHEFFEDSASQRELAIESIDYFRKSDVRKPEFYQLDPSPEKFIKSSRRIFDLDTNALTDPLNDPESESWYVAQVADRRFPPASGMTKDEFEGTKRSIEQQKMMEQRYPQLRQQRGGEEPENPFAIDKLVETYDLGFYQQAKPEEGAEGAEGGPEKGPEKGKEQPPE
ncbi:MAG: SurA N-terminal domain-containing protein [Planctomycetota bacterium]|jgi:hypothetical protein